MTTKTYDRMYGKHTRNKLLLTKEKQGRSRIMSEDIADRRLSLASKASNRYKQYRCVSP